MVCTKSHFTRFREEGAMFDPIGWSIDNHDGGLTWLDTQTVPGLGYKDDADTAASQRREFRNKLLEIETVTMMVQGGK